MQFTGITIVGGMFFGKALPPQGYYLWTWGSNYFGALGLGDDDISRSSPVQVGLDADWTQVNPGGQVNLALKTNGTLWTWGANFSGQLGLDDLIDRSSPTQVGTDATWASLGIGGTYNAPGCAIKTNNTLWTWGSNYSGQLGLGDLIDRSSPTQVGSETTWLQIATGNRSVAAVRTDGTLWSWGYNEYGQLGQNIGSINYRVVISPIRVGLGTTWLNISAGYAWSLATRTDGTLWSWGYNNQGELGLGDAGEYNSRSSPTQIGTDSDWAFIAAGEYSGFGIKNNNTLWSWGNNGSGRLGLSNQFDCSSPTQVGVDTDWYKIDVGNNFTLAIKDDSTLWAWGSNYSGQLGQGVTGYNSYDCSSPTQIGVDTGWTSISGGGGFQGSGGTSFGLAVKNGTLWAWGSQYSGELGLNNLINRSSPVQVGSDTNWAQVTAGRFSTLAVKTTGTLWGWGLNYNGELGLGDAGSYTSRSSPTQIGTDSDWTRVIAGDGFTLAVKTNGSVWSWGSNFKGRLGLGNRTDYSSPVQVGTDSDWAQVTAGSQSSLAVTTTGSLWAWGQNGQGQLGINRTGFIYRDRSSPVQVGSDTTWRKISVGWGMMAAVHTDGSLWTWGHNTRGQLGLGDAGSYTSRSSPTQVGLDTTWLDVSVAAHNGAQDRVLAIKTNGTLWAWGQNGQGQLGLDDRINRSSPVQIGTDTTWAWVSAAGRNNLAGRTDGTVWSWGNNGSGQLGLGDRFTYRSSPTQVGVDTNWIVGNASQYSSAALRSEPPPPPPPRYLWTWGSNDHGQLGTNNQINYSSPVQIGTNTDWLNSSAGYTSTVAIKTNNTLWSWGRNNRGQLGIGNIINRSSPVQVGSDATWLVVSAGYQLNLAVKTNGTLWSWGYNSAGELGIGDRINRSNPVQIGSDTTWSSKISGGRSTPFAIRTTGTLWGWGTNGHGQLGLGDQGFTTGRSSPTQIGSDTNWAQVSSSLNTTFAIKTTGTLWAWGYNDTGQLGLGNRISRSSPVQVGSDTTWASVCASNALTLAVKTTGTLWGWGLNYLGQLGIGNSTRRSVPTQIGTDTTWASVNNGNRGQTIATKTDGTMWIWGSGVLSPEFQSLSSPVQLGTDANWYPVSRIAGSLSFVTLKSAP